MHTPKPVALHGIPNCDTVKKARAWLAGHGVDCDFHDFKKSGVTAEQLQRWAQAVGWERLLNRRGTTWRQLPAQAQAGATDARTACALMQQHPSLIKRPVVQWADGSITVGFEPQDWAGRAR